MNEFPPAPGSLSPEQYLLCSDEYDQSKHSEEKKEAHLNIVSMKAFCSCKISTLLFCVSGFSFDREEKLEHRVN